MIQLHQEPNEKRSHNSKSSSATVAFTDNRSENTRQLKVQEMANQPIQRQANKTGMPDNLKSGIENLSGMDMSDVKVHYNSSQPAQLQAHAFAQGNQIHIASGQERHLPHEAWHVVQQKQGRVFPTKQLKGKVNINDDDALEKEADVMGSKALQVSPENNTLLSTKNSAHIIQKIQIEYLRGLESVRFNEICSFVAGQTSLSIVDINLFLKKYVDGDNMKVVMGWNQKFISNLPWKTHWKNIFKYPENYYKNYSDIDSSDTSDLNRFYKSDLKPNQDEMHFLLGVCRNADDLYHQFLLIDSATVMQLKKLASLVPDPINGGKLDVLLTLYGKFKTHEKVTDIIKFILFDITPHQNKAVIELGKASESFLSASKTKESLKNELGLTKTNEFKGLDEFRGPNNMWYRNPNSELLKSNVKKRILASNPRLTNEAIPDIARWFEYTTSEKEYYRQIHDELYHAQSNKNRTSAEMESKKFEMGKFEEDGYTQQEQGWMRENGLSIPEKRSKTSKSLTSLALKITGIKEILAMRDKNVKLLDNAGQGATSINGNLKISLGVGNDFGKAEAFGQVELFKKMSINDDRRFRSTQGRKFSLEVESSLLFKLFQASLAGSYGSTTTQVFRNSGDYLIFDNHQLYKDVNDLLKDIHPTAPELALDPETAQEVRQIQNSEAAAKYKIVEGTSGGYNAAGSALFVGASGGKSDEKMKFISEDRQEKLHATAHVESASFNVGAFSVEIATSDIKNHSVGDNDGEYLNVKVTMNQPVSAQFRSENPDYGVLKGAIETMKLPGEKVGMTQLISLAQTHLDGYLKSRFHGFLSLSATLFSVKPSIEANYIWEKNEYVEQYSRMSMTSDTSLSVGVSGGTGFAYGGLEIGGGMTGTYMANESIGVDTLSYILTVYNGYKEHSTDKWDEWKQKHKTNIESALRKQQNIMMLHEASRKARLNTSIPFDFENIDLLMDLLFRVNKLEDAKSNKREWQKRNNPPTQIR